MSKDQRALLSGMSQKMRSMAAEMREFTESRTLPSPQVNAPAPASLPAQLQINQTGSWRSALDFDLAAAPPEFLETADQLARMAGSKTTMRVVSCRRTDSGSTMPTGNVLKRWDRESGWVDSTPPKS
jgi:hypothetical protein